MGEIDKHVIVLSPEMMQAAMEEERPTEEEEPHEHVATLWVRTKNKFQPSSTIAVTKELDPGVYVTGYDREEGYYCQKLDTSSDQLFVFSDSVTVKLLKEIDLFWNKRDLYKEHKLIHKRGILLEGYSGTGKSSAITQVSEEVMKRGGVVFKVTDFKNLDDYVGFMRIGFRKIQPETPIITILEDIEQYEEVAAQLLDFLDGKTHLNHHIVIATTNNTVKIPDTFLRPSRIDLRIEIPLPSEETRREYFQFKGVKEDILEELVRESKDCSLADLKEIYICIFLLDYTVNEALMKIKSAKSKKNYTISPKKQGVLGLQ